MRSVNESHSHLLPTNTRSHCNRVSISSFLPYFSLRLNLSAYLRLTFFIHINIIRKMSSTATQTDSQAEVSKWDYAKDVDWYLKEPGNLRSECRKLFENYSHIPPEEVEPHILELVSLTMFLPITYGY